MAKKTPYGWVGIIPKGNLLDAEVKQTVFEILREVPKKPNALGLGIFHLPPNGSVSFSKFVTSWIAFFPDARILHARTDEEDSTKYEIWFDKDVVLISNGAGDRETRFLTIGESEISIRINNTEHLVTARKTQTEAQHWVDNKTIEILKAQEQQPS